MQNQRNDTNLFGQKRANCRPGVNDWDKWGNYGKLEAAAGLIVVINACANA